MAALTDCCQSGILRFLICLELKLGKFLGLVVFGCYLSQIETWTLGIDGPVLLLKGD